MVNLNERELSQEAHEGQTAVAPRASSRQLFLVLGTLLDTELLSNLRPFL